MRIVNDKAERQPILAVLIMERSVTNHYKIQPIAKLRFCRFATLMKEQVNTTCRKGRAIFGFGAI